MLAGIAVEDGLLDTDKYAALTTRARGHRIPRNDGTARAGHDRRSCLFRRLRQAH